MTRRWAPARRWAQVLGRLAVLGWVVAAFVLWIGSAYAGLAMSAAAAMMLAFEALVLGGVGLTLFWLGLVCWRRARDLWPHAGPLPRRR